MEIDSSESIILPSSSCQVKGVKKIKLDQEEFIQQKSPPEAVVVVPEPEKPRVRLQEFQFPSTDPAKFVKTGKTNTLTEIMELITTGNTVNLQKRQDPITIQTENMATAQLCPNVKRPKLIINKGNIKSLYGFDIDENAYLHPEEALYLMETGKLEVLTEGVPLSVERGRLLFLQSSQIPSCSAADYAVYKHFSKLGYRVQRRIPDYLSSYPIVQQQDPETGENQMEEDKDSNEKSSSSMELGSTRGTKRRASEDCPGEEADVSDSNSSSSVQSMEGASAIIEDSDCEFLEEVEKNPSGGDSADVLFGEVSMDDVELPMPPDVSPPQPYIVQESDSDVEFVDEVSYWDVLIEELSTDTDYSSVHFDEAGPSTSKGTQVFVDLVSSDSETEEVLEYYEPIWSKCVPNTKMQFMFPPRGLLPGDIFPRDTSKVYEYNFLKDPQESTDLEIETIVDNLRIEGNVTPTYESSAGGSWKEWRQNAMEEAKQVINDSLIGKPAPSATADFKTIGNKKLHQWIPPTYAETTGRKETKSLHMPYDLYPQSAAQVHRNKLGVIVKPIHRLAVVSGQELIPDIGNFPSNEEEPPLLVGVLGEDSNIVQLLCNAGPLPSLF